MKNTICQILILFFLAINFNFTNEEIVFVFEHFRHGARSSVYLSKFFKDIYNIPWIGDGEITPMGMRMLYLLGVHIRTKYNNIIKKETHINDLLIYSSDLNRTIVSAQSQLLGMFPPNKGKELTNKQIELSQPLVKFPEEGKEEINQLKNISIPIEINAFPFHFFNREGKPYLLTQEEECPKMAFIKKKNFKENLLIKEFIKKFKAKYGLKLMSFFQINDITLFDDYYFLLGVTDHFISNYIHRRTELKSFDKTGIDFSEFFNECVEFKNLSLFQIESDQETGVMAASPIFIDMINYMDLTIINIKKNDVSNKKAPKFVMYSGRDYIISAVQIFLNNAFGSPCHYVGFAANQFFELHKRDDIDNSSLTENDFWVEYFYNGELLINVSYPVFKEKISLLIWSIDKINRFCKVEKVTYIDYLFYIVLAFSSFSIIFSMIKETFDSKKRKNTANIDVFPKGYYSNLEHS